MENNRYKSPEIEVIQMSAEQAVMISSLSGEGINDWEDM